MLSVVQPQAEPVGTGFTLSGYAADNANVVQTADAAGGAPTEAFTPTIADLSVLSLLASARQGLARLDTVQSAADRQSAYSQALEALVGLYQLHGCEWARPALREIYARDASPYLFIGYSADGRARLRVEELELRNPAFTDYTFLLVTLESHSSLTLKADMTAPLVVFSKDGTQHVSAVIDADHPLWPNLSGLAGTFDAPKVLPPTYGISFKQVYGVKLPRAALDRLALAWGSYEIEVPVRSWLDEQ